MTGIQAWTIHQVQKLKKDGNKGERVVGKHVPFYIFVKYIFFSAYMIKHSGSFLYSYSESSHVLNPSIIYICGINVNLYVYI